MAKSVIVVWTKTGVDGFEKNIPLLWSGRRNRKLGSKNKIDVLFLQGYESLNKSYLANLKSTGYSLFDVSKIYKARAKKYKNLNRFGDYEKKCFLRWLVIKKFYQKSPLIHFDADVVFNETPEALSKRLGKYTFVLQGCPAFVSIANYKWLDCYQNALNQFVKNIEKYSKIAWKQRKGWQKSFKKKWAGSRFRPVISSDQDLISHLIHTDQLPQDSPGIIKKAASDMILFENPLYFFELNKKGAPFVYRRKGLVDYLNNKKAAFWHMQTNFADYLKKIYLLKQRFLIPGRIHNPLESKKKKIDNIIYSILYTTKIPQNFKRIHIYKYFFEEKDFSLVFNNKTFWKGVFG